MVSEYISYPLYLIAQQIGLISLTLISLLIGFIIGIGIPKLISYYSEYKASKVVPEPWDELIGGGEKDEV